MKTLHEIEKLTNETLSSLDHIQPAQANPFLYTRVISRLQSKHNMASKSGMRLMLGFTIVLLLLLCINVLNIQLLKKQPANTNASGISALYQAYFPHDNDYSY